MRTRVEISWVDLTASWLTGVELCGVIALHCNAYHGMLWRGWTAAYSFHMMCGVCVVAVVFFIANISLCLPYSYLIAILMLNIKLYVCSVPTTFLHTNNNRNIHISYTIYCDVHIVGELLLPPIRCCVHICLNSTCLCDFSKNLYTSFSTFFSFYLIFTFLSPCIGLVVGRSNVKLSVHSIQNINLFGM